MSGTRNRRLLLKSACIPDTPSRAAMLFGRIDVNHSNPRHLLDEHSAHRHDRVDDVHQHRNKRGVALEIRIPCCLMSAEPCRHERLVHDRVVFGPRVPLGDRGYELQDTVPEIPDSQIRPPARMGSWYGGADRVSDRSRASAYGPSHGPSTASRTFPFSFRSSATARNTSSS